MSESMVQATTEQADNSSRSPEGLRLCLFCRKTEIEVRRLIVAHGAGICDKCVLECVTVVFDICQPIHLSRSNDDGTKTPPVA